MNSTRVLTVPGDSYTITAGRKKIVVRYCGGHGVMAVYSVEILSNSVVARPIGNDDRSFNHQDTADHYAQMAADLARVEVEGVDTDALAAAINADMDARDTQRAAAQQAQDDDIAQIMAASRGFRGVQPRPTMAGAHLADITAPQRRALNAAHNGQIAVGPGVGAATLTSLARKGYGRLRYEGRRYAVAALVLNSRGLAEATKSGVAA